jgi:glyoxylase-like metal-dependent hydrolase (beta-lactamase superfamily II)
LFARWLSRFFWHPLEALFLRAPLVPIALQTQEVAPGVLLLRLDNVVTRALSRFSGGFDYAVLYLVDNELVFDTGYAWAGRTLAHLVKEKGLGDSLRYIVNSHSHEDHTGNNHHLLELCKKALVYAHPQAHPEMAFPSVRPWYRRFLFGPERAHAVQSTPECLVLSSGRRLERVDTPGHTAGHICLYDPQARFLLSGDLFVEETLDSQLQDVSGPDWIQSLRQVLLLDLDLLLDGHGLVFRGAQVAERLQAKLRFLEQLRERVRQSIQTGPKPLAEVVDDVARDRDLVNLVSMNEGWMNLITLGDFSRSNLIRSFVDEFLSSPQEVRKEEHDEFEILPET